MAALMPERRVKVLLDGVDISQSVHAVQIDMRVDAVVMTQLELFCGVDFKDDVLTLTSGRPSLTASIDDAFTVEGLRVRAITFGRLDDDQ